MRGVPVVTQVHAGLAHDLPASPSAAFTAVTGNARNTEARLAGAALVGDNLGTALGAARQDALCAQLLFLFLGVPGAILAGGAMLGTLIAVGFSRVLVKVLTGVFDPAPDSLAVPWVYLAVVLALTLAAVAAAGALTLRALRRPGVEQLRDI